MSTGVIIGIIVIIVIVLIFIIGIAISASSDNSTTPEPDTTVPEPDTSTPESDLLKILFVEGLYSSSKSTLSVIGENFTSTSTWTFENEKGTISYNSPTYCEITINKKILSGVLTIINDKSKSNEFAVTLTEEKSVVPVIKLSTIVKQCETENYYYYPFTAVTNGAIVNVLSKIEKEDDFGIICVAGGGGGGKAQMGVSSGGGGGGASYILRNISAEMGTSYSVTVGSGGTESVAGSDSSVIYKGSSGAIHAQAIARGGKAGNNTAAGLGGTSTSVDDITEGFGTKHTATGGNGGDQSNGSNATYTNDDAVTTNKFTDIPEELIGIDGISECYGGGGGGGCSNSTNVSYSGGEGGKGGAMLLDTGGLRGAKNGTDYNGKTATHYGGGGGAGGLSKLDPMNVNKMKYGKGGSGKNGCVIFFILKSK